MTAGAVERGTYTVEQAAAIVGISPSAVYRACARGEFPHLRIGRLIVIPMRRFHLWLEGEAGEIQSHD